MKREAATAMLKLASRTFSACAPVRCSASRRRDAVKALAQCPPSPAAADARRPRTRAVARGQTFYGDRHWGPTARRRRRMNMFRGPRSHRARGGTLRVPAKIHAGTCHTVLGPTTDAFARETPPVRVDQVQTAPSPEQFANDRHWRLNTRPRDNAMERHG